MASSRAFPILLRSARATSSSTSSAILCPSCRSFNPVSTSIISTRRHYADAPPPRSSLTDILGLNKSKSTAPSPAPIEPTSIIPGRQSSGLVFPSSSTGRPGRLANGTYSDIIDNPSIGDVVHPPGATLLDPWVQLFHLHVYATKHNTHITFTDPKKNAIISSSTGILGFRKAGRHSYDAAYQLAAHVFQKIEEKGLIPKKVEVVLRGFGVGREAVTKALMGKEGRYIKDVVVRVTDATRTKFGGTKSKGRRRL